MGIDLDDEAIPKETLRLAANIGLAVTLGSAVALLLYGAARALKPTCDCDPFWRELDRELLGPMFSAPMRDIYFPPC